VLARSEPEDDLSGLSIATAALGQELLRAGRNEEALVRFDHLLEVIGHYRERFPDDFVRDMQAYRAISQLRLGFYENCIGLHAAKRCAIPIAADAVYEHQRGPRGATEQYVSLLEQQPDDMRARWLLNVAHMALGEYPDRVPDRWLIPLEAFESEHPIEPFQDIAPGLGLDVIAHAGGSIMDDFDGDGYLDIMTSSRGSRDQLRYFRSNGDGTFTERTESAGLTGLVGGLNLVHADYNNDGHLDVFVLRGGWLPHGLPNSLLRNNGNDTFEDVTEEAGLLESHPTQTATWGDFDNDGWIDLYIGDESIAKSGFMGSTVPSSGTRDPSRHPSELFRNNGDGTFTDVAHEAGAAVVGMIKGVVSGDFDNDGWLDLFVSRLDEPNLLLRNRGAEEGGVWMFEDVSVAAGITEPKESFSTWFWDFDNDGWLDIFVAGYKATHGDVAAEYLGLPHQAVLPRLYRNMGDRSFTDATGMTGLNRIMHQMGGNYGDIDNDGFADIYSATGNADVRTLIPNRMFRNADGVTFHDVTTAGGVGLLHKGHGVAFGDLDNDGDQDLYVNMGGAFEGDVAPNALFENPGYGNEWITLRFIGARSNRAAIGARIRVIVETATGVRDVYTVVSAGGSFGANSLQQEIGLGDATAIREVTVKWPVTGSIDTYRNLAMREVYTLREGDPTPTRVVISQISLSRR
jgi:hypothetical protein